MMVELVVCFLPAGERLAVDGDGAVVIGTHAMSIVLKRIDMHAARPHMHLAREGNIDKWLIAAISVLSRRLSLVSHIRRLGVGATVLQVVGIVGRLPI